MEGNGKMHRLREFNDQIEMAEEAAKRVAGLLYSAIKKDSRASLAVSGGRTPKLFFEALSQKDIPWEKVEIILVDERWVDTYSKDSNERLVKEYLLKNLAKSARFIGLKTKTLSAKDGTFEINSKITPLKWPLDCVVLGMGDDGHTASLFPGTDLSSFLNENAPGPYIPSWAPYPPRERVTLAPKEIINAHAIVLLLIGDKKIEVFSKALLGKDLEEMPIRLVLEKEVSLEVFWAKEAQAI